jgi:hypothetical protein
MPTVSGQQNEGRGGPPLVSARVSRVDGQTGIPPYRRRCDVTGLDENIRRVAAPLKQRVQHLVPHQPLLTQGTRRQIDPVPFADPPGMGHFATQLDRAGWCVDGVEGDLGHLAGLAGAGNGLVPPFLIQSQGRNNPGTPQRCQRSACCPRRGAGAGTYQ